MGFAFGPQTLVKAPEDRIVTRGSKRGHVQAAAQSRLSADDGAFTAAYDQFAGGTPATTKVRRTGVPETRCRKSAII